MHVCYHDRAMTRSPRPSRCAFRIAALLLFAGVLLTSSPALAHARLTKSTPKEKAELALATTQVELWFNELLDEGFNHVIVFPASEVKLKAKDRTNFAAGKPEVDQTDRTHLTVALKGLAPGEYVIEYRVLSRDGHTAPGRVRFTVKPAA